MLAMIRPGPTARISATSTPRIGFVGFTGGCKSTSGRPFATAPVIREFADGRRDDRIELAGGGRSAAAQCDVPGVTTHVTLGPSAAELR